MGTTSRSRIFGEGSVNMRVIKQLGHIRFEMLNGLPNRKVGYTFAFVGLKLRKVGKLGIIIG